VTCSVACPTRHPPAACAKSSLRCGLRCRLNWCRLTPNKVWARVCVYLHLYSYTRVHTFVFVFIHTYVWTFVFVFIYTQCLRYKRERRGFACASWSAVCLYIPGFHCTWHAGCTLLLAGVFSAIQSHSAHRQSHSAHRQCTHTVTQCTHTVTHCRYTVTQCSIQSHSAAYSHTVQTVHTYSHTVHTDSQPYVLSMCNDW